MLTDKEKEIIIKRLTHGLNVSQKDFENLIISIVTENVSRNGALANAIRAKV